MIAGDRGLADAQPPDLHPVLLMDMGFAIHCPLARHCLPPIQFLSIGSRFCSALLAATPLRFAITSPPSGCEETCTSRLLNMLGTQ
jgi:hypothetical protein